jgi:thiamine phosphate synthase YjbQ (UPF0047 family)
VRRDLMTTLETLAPEDALPHVEEGPDDMRQATQSMLTDVGLSIPVMDGG